ncbi:TPA: hypothetical protein QC175_001829 [Bacillus cereus]|nr:hypothetical protein [Bacillus cereus]HDR8330582.1 hypothetical protein [Bacillus cereus]HDR8338016.1 hypothetical protein [Bacillus cereus]
MTKFFEVGPRVDVKVKVKKEDFKANKKKVLMDAFQDGNAYICNGENYFVVNPWDPNIPDADELNGEFHFELPVMRILSEGVFDKRIKELQSEIDKVYPLISDDSLKPQDPDDYAKADKEYEVLVARLNEVESMKAYLTNTKL